MKLYLPDLLKNDRKAITQFKTVIDKNCNNLLVKDIISIAIENPENSLGILAAITILTTTKTYKLAVAKNLVSQDYINKLNFKIKVYNANNIAIK